MKRAIRSSYSDGKRYWLFKYRSMMDQVTRYLVIETAFEMKNAYDAERLADDLISEPYSKLVNLGSHESKKILLDDLEGKEYTCVQAAINIQDDTLLKDFNFSVYYTTKKGESFLDELSCTVKEVAARVKKLVRSGFKDILIKCPQIVEDELHKLVAKYADIDSSVFASDSETYVDTSEIAKVAEDDFASNEPKTGCTFIAPSGKFINIYPKLDTHEDLCEYIEDKLGIELPYKDEEYFIREHGYIRLRNDPTMIIIELTSNKPTKQQMYSLEDWLLFVEEKHLSSPCPLYLNVCDGSDADVEFNFCRDYFADDILKICNRYYSSGKLYAKTEIDH